jgi:hypothetical protein
MKMVSIKSMFIGVAILGIVVGCVIAMFGMLNTEHKLQEVLTTQEAHLGLSNIRSLNRTLNRLDTLNSSLQDIQIQAGTGQDETEEKSFIDRMWEGTWGTIKSLGSAATFTTGSFGVLYGLFESLYLVSIPNFVIKALGIIVIIVVIFATIGFIGKRDL